MAISPCAAGLCSCPGCGYLPMGFGSLFCSSVGGLPDFTPIAQVDRPKAKPAHLGGCVFASRQRIRTQKWTRDFARRQGPCFQR